MAKRLVLTLVLFFLLPAAALAATVHVRVEGMTQTIFAPTTVTVTATNALDALQQTAIDGEFYYHITQTSFGPYVDQIGLYPGSGDSGWAFKVDNASPPVGANAVTLKDGDSVLWYWATFGPNGDPPTLSLSANAKGCYTALAYDDNGKTTQVSGLVFHVGSKRTIAGSVGTAVCPGPHPGVLVRATATGAVRSNAVK